MQSMRARSVPPRRRPNPKRFRADMIWATLAPANRTDNVRTLSRIVAGQFSVFDRKAKRVRPLHLLVPAAAGLSRRPCTSFSSPS
jgi:hypothetical protein